MKIQFQKKILLAFFLLYLPVQSMAWGLLGHRVVGQLAESYLNKKTSREIKLILGNENLAMASNWADFIKSEPSYNYISNWHYINLPAGLNEEQLDSALKRDTITDIYTKILFLTAELKKKNLEQEKKVMYLRLLIHFVAPVCYCLLLFASVCCS